MIIDRQVEAVVLLARNSIVGRLHREEIEDRRGADEMRGPAAALRRVGDAAARRDRNLAGVRGQK